MRLLDRSPVPKDPSEVVVRQERVTLRADQIVVWVSLSFQSANAPGPAALPFPVILDTGHNHTFSIHERHLTDWAGLRPELLAVRGAISATGDRVPLQAVKIWVHPNVPHQRERLADRPPVPIVAQRGMAVYPGREFPRLPILGLRAITDNELVLKVDGRRREATLRTGGTWWPFALIG